MLALFMFKFLICRQKELKTKAVRPKLYPNNYCTEQVNSSSNSSGLYLKSGQFESWISQNTGYPILSGVRLSPLGTAATIGLLYQPQMIDEVIIEQLMQ
jgi:hypothetical protein